MTATLDPPQAVDPEEEPPAGHAPERHLAGAATSGTSATEGGEPGDPDAEAAEEVPPVGLRPLLAAALACTSAALTAGGIFGSLGARLIGVAGVAVGVGWVWLTLRSRKPQIVQLGLVPVCLVVSGLSLLPSRSPAELPNAVADAIAAGRLLRPPVPFDAGWRPVVFTMMALLAFVAGWVAASMRRPTLAVALPLPVTAIMAITQPASQQVMAGVLAFAPVLAAFSVLFTSDDGGDELSRAFELRRAIRSMALGVPAIVALVLLANASFLFPKPVYDPTDQPQKPRAVPLSAARDRVLFEVTSDSGLTGPWRTGVLDVYDGSAWRLPPFDRARFEPVTASGQVADERANAADISVTITVRDLGDSSVLPSLPTTTNLFGGPAGVLYDPRAGVFRMAEGRVPADASYELLVPRYPTADELRDGPAADPVAFEETLEVPDPPQVVVDLLRDAPQDPWARLAVVRDALYDVVVAAGAGSPTDVTNETVERLLTGDHEGTPFEIVAVEALLARWAGVPSRIGFGFDGLNIEGEEGLRTVRPKNAAQWLEVHFANFGWVPLIETPEQAKATLDSDPNARFDTQIQPSDDVAVEVFLPIEVRDARQLFELVRARLLQVLPWLLAALTLWLTYPAAAKALRRQRRRKWAATRGPRAQIVVEYAEFRDAATDLSVGDPYDTPLEYLLRVQDDAQHAELAWLVARVLYGDMVTTCTAHDARAAEELSDSLRRRMARAQPVQTRAMAFISRSSLRRPYSTELPTVRLPRPRHLPRVGGLTRRRKHAAAPR